MACWAWRNKNERVKTSCEKTEQEILAPKLNRELGFLWKGGACSLAHPASLSKPKHQSLYLKNFPQGALIVWPMAFSNDSLYE
jgi:hypothetical protein